MQAGPPGGAVPRPGQRSQQLQPANLTAAGSTIKGLILTRFGGDAIRFQANDVTIQGCYLGTDAAGAAGLGNGGSGIANPFGGINALIGGTNPGEGNVLASNGIYGFNLFQSGHRLLGNFVGTDPTGARALPNQTGGGFIGANNVTVGGTAPGARNVISGNLGPGFYINTGNNCIVQGNLIGLNAAGTADLGNQTEGIHLASGGGHLIGGLVPEARNVISGNGGAGIAVFTSNNRIQGNYLGISADGSTAIANNEGVSVGRNGVTGTQIGGTDPAARNVISGNVNAGVHLSAGPTGTQVEGNYLGTNAAGTAALPNGQGVLIEGQNNFIGGTAAGAGNLISGNSVYGVRLNAAGNQVLGNKIGTTADGAAGLPNTDAGVFGYMGSNTVGGTAAGAGNVIAFNGSAGVESMQITGLSLRGNSIFANAGLGIDIAPAGVSTAPSFPTLTRANSSGSRTAVAGTFSSSANLSFTLDFYASAVGDPSGFGEGQLYLGSTMVTTDGSGNTSFAVTLPVAAPVGWFLSATATDSLNTTSEFSRWISIFGNARPVLVVNTGLVVPQGGTLVLSAGQLLATDADNTPAELVFQLTALPAHGVLQRNGTTLALGGSFTQQDIFDGLVQYIHDGSATTSDGFSFDLSDGTSFTLELASGGLGGAAANSISDQPAVSADGRYVAFRSQASNLVAGDTNNRQDIFLYDRLTGQTTRVSVAGDGSQGNGDSANSFYNGAAVSGTGQYVAFASSATNLVANDTNGWQDVFVRNLAAGTTTRVSVSSAAAQANNGSASYGVGISASGQQIGFSSFAGNLVFGDSNGVEDIFLRDQQLNQTSSISTTPANARSDDLAVSGDGRFVAFRSLASNLVLGDTNNRYDIFVRDRVNNQTFRVSLGPGGIEANGDSGRPSLSADGRFIAFESLANNLVPNDSNNVSDVFVHDRQTGVTTRVSVRSDGVEGSRTARTPSLSADGRFVAFSTGSSLVPLDDFVEDVYVYDTLTKQVRRVSVRADGVPGNNNSYSPSLSADGLTVAFQTAASNLVPGAGIGNHIVVARLGAVPGAVAITITPPPPLRVTTFTKTNSGFTAVFNRALATTGLNLYDSQAANLGPADVIVSDSAGNGVRGSIVIGASNDRITFINTGDALAPGTYTVTLRSAANAFHDTSGSLLDGDNDGTPGGDYTNSLAIDPLPAVTVRIPDIARGPGQDVNLPLRLSGSAGVTDVTVFLAYNANILDITNVSVAPGLPAGAQAFLSGGSGVVRIDFTSPELPAGITDFVRLTARVSTGATGAYTRKQVLDLGNVTVNDQPGLDDDGLHVVAYFGDASGNGTLSSLDAALTLRDAVGFDSGLDAYQLADPRIVVDINGNGRVDATDATWILQKAVGLPRPEIPDRPAGITIPTPSGPDPLLFIPKTLAGRPGDTITVPVLLDRSEGLRSVDLAIAYDVRRLELLTADGVHLGSLTNDFDLLLFNADAAAGTLRVGLSRSAGPLDDQGPGSVLLLTFRIKADAPAGKAIVNLRRSLDGTETALNEGGLDLNPEPRDRAGDVLDGVVTILPVRRRGTAPVVGIDAFFGRLEPELRQASNVIAALLSIRDAGEEGGASLAGLLSPRRRAGG